MKKIGIISIYDNNNIGNRLQAYALYSFLNKQKFNCLHIKSYPNIKYSLKMTLKCYLSIFQRNFKWERYRNFRRFNKNIKYSNYVLLPFFSNTFISNKFSKFIVGSDQVWNPEFAGFNFFFLDFVRNSNKKISYAASVGVSNVSDEYKGKMRKYLKDFKCVSVREDQANRLLTDLLHRDDIKTLIDPTMLLNNEQWERLEKKPKALGNDQFVLLYFLGSLSEKRYNQIKEIARKENCKIVNILDQSSPFYSSGPAEFLYLEHHAKYVFTDSFHSSVFSVLFYTPFVIYNREEKGVISMNTRIDTLVNTLKLKNRWYNEKNITKENLEVDYSEAYKILDDKRRESLEFLKQALSD